MNWFESIVYGLISGITEFLPLSSFAHQQIYLTLCGEALRDPARDLFVHIAMLCALWISCRPMLEQIRRSRRVGHRGASNESKVGNDRHLVSKATLPMLIAFFVLRYIIGTTSSMLLTSVILILNGLVLFVPDRLVRSNKDSGAMKPLAGVLIGTAGALSAIPGFSRIGCNISVSSMLGADRQHSLKWAILLSIPALWGQIIIDLILLFTGSVISHWSHLLYYIITAAGAFGSSYCGIKLLRFISIRLNLSSFSYYSWGASLIAFFLYLTVV